MAEDNGENRGIEQQLESAVCARLQHFKDQADALTLESVRRLLEKDLGLEKFALDAHKRFIRHFLEKKMDGADDCESKTATENVDQDDNVSKQEADILHEQLETMADNKKASSGDEEIMEDSPIKGVLTPKSEGGTQVSSLSKSRIEEAIWGRADHFRANSQKLTLAGVRRLLEEDLGVDKHTLDPFKKLISQQIDQVLNSPKGATSVEDVEKKATENIKSKKSKVSSKEEPDTLHSGSDEMEDKIKLRKEAAPRRNIKKLEQPKKRKISEKTDFDASSKKQNMLMKRQKQEDNNSDDDGSVSEDGQSPASAEKIAKGKEKPAPGYGKQVENLKSIIKACGMSVAPSIYKKAKQVPDNKREAFIVKELEGILSREGLSKNPSEKEIKDCRKRKDTARELEGIDMSNIISSSRRRSTFSFVAPEKPGVRAKKEKVDSGDVKKNENNDTDQNDDSEEEKEKEEGKKKEKKEEEKEEGKKKEKKEEEKEEGKKKEKKEEEKEEGKKNDKKQAEKEEVEEKEEENEEEEEEVDEEVEDEDDSEEEDEDESEDFNEDDNEDSD